MDGAGTIGLCFDVGAVLAYRYGVDIACVYHLSAKCKNLLRMPTTCMSSLTWITTTPQSLVYTCPQLVVAYNRNDELI